MADIQVSQLEYRTDSYGNPLYAKLYWKHGTLGDEQTKPIAMIFHGGGLIVGSADTVPKMQIWYLCQRNFLVVIPNYRLCPQVSALDSYNDVDEAYSWTRRNLASLMQDYHAVYIDQDRIALMGHSIGATLALHLATRGKRLVKAVAAFYPSLYISEPENSSHKPFSGAPFGSMPDYTPSEADWKAIKPDNVQISAAPLALPGTRPMPRNLWHASLIKKGTWIQQICPDGDYAAIDPCLAFGHTGKAWPPTLFVQGDQDNLPGSGLELVQRAVGQLKQAGAMVVETEVVPGETHMFDLPPSVGTTDLGPKWLAVKRGLDFLVENVR